ncbi:flagellar biosynthesis protein FlgB [Thiocapsa imhoffii]|uniref:Flagellar biosynthesis protein FlgB n=1 Tax=Thiocapsa imhoffii TaxID=382777 RepID=A0A9X1B8U4_9GAMM|nr:TIGR04282 family arsenosugar biosynthesis glycosyltransferase [Thiocapsa imhoffii]MBK1644346.1 flagellar biosynthesis protein FlgB [Thiocapsa imhoffii]
MRFPEARILVFAKAPVPGRVKTRLTPVLTPARAAALAHDLLVECVERLTRTALAPLELWCAPDSSHPCFQALAAAHGLSLHRQQGRDLGERLAWATAEALRRSEAVLLVGTDSPELDAEYCARALAGLEQAPSVIGPAEDGGYVLLGLKTMVPEIFRDMPWGSATVGALTRSRLHGLGHDCIQLPMLWDLDRPADLERYQRLRATRASAHGA